MKLRFPRSLFALAPIAFIACLGFCAVAVQIDPGGDLPEYPAGPALTLDEGFYVEGGIRLATGLKAWATGAITWREIFGEKEDLGPKAPLGYYLVDHPPAGRVWLGLWHEALPLDVDRPEPEPHVVIAKGRIGSAVAFALLMFLIGAVATRWYGLIPGVISALSLLLMPRVFGHAHLASLETIMNLTYAAAILFVARWWRDDREGTSTPPKFSQVAVAGLVWGIALLTKIQAVLIGPPVVLWALWHWRGKAILPLLVWGGVALGVFFVGWPLLWFGPLAHTLQYFKNSADRMTLYVWYAGERFADTEAPWHYAFVMFLITMPLGILFWGFCGLTGCGTEYKSLRADARLQLLLAAVIFPMILFAIPGVAVYDGVRLFLISFPLSAIFAGRGAVFTWRWLCQRAGKKFAIPITLGLVCSPLYGHWATGPLYLNYYSETIGGLRGADHLGMETNYWGDGLTRDFWNQVVETVPPNSTVHVTPVLHPLQLTFMQSQLPLLEKRGITLKPCIPGEMEDVTYLVKFYRKADLAPPIEQALENNSPTIQIERQGVPLGEFYQFEP
ncbi:MAG: glycosyltransferase family 39 protein [Planctomycetaceae bacterium]|nr:glycosyltransferase family 39 protein [Planctomycetaceae bacterium]